MVKFRLREMTPCVGVSRPASNLKSVDLPLPFSPTSPIRCPSNISTSTSSKTGFPPKSLLTFEKLTSSTGILLENNVVQNSNNQYKRMKGLYLTATSQC